ncbi:hypothetical protein PsYK624_162380 [Phanerochaete sordida]|uniref:Uncharacterized protein n=1 Tax=Phanerochaete sordida TaxID=48140 RepID=A0A9P3GQJ4_9APHY|nr:hypothetical protein PsYK624_162380 [Phanerochaete sordida]
MRCSIYYSTSSLQAASAAETTGNSSRLMRDDRLAPVSDDACERGGFPAECPTWRESLTYDPANRPQTAAGCIQSSSSREALQDANVLNGFLDAVRLTWRLRSSLSWGTMVQMLVLPVIPLGSTSSVGSADATGRGRAQQALPLLQRLETARRKLSQAAPRALVVYLVLLAMKASFPTVFG